MTIQQDLNLDTRIFIVHPHYRQPRYLLSALINLSNVLYLRFDKAAELENVQGEADYEFVILDEFDRLSHSEGQEVIERLLRQYPNSYLTLFSRHLPDLPPEQRAIAQLFPIDEEIGLIDYYQQYQTVVEFFAFGSGAMAINGKRHELDLDDSQCLLLFYLLEKERASLKTLLDLFWEDVPERTASRALHNKKTRLNDALGIDLLVFQDGFYRINPKLEIIYDVANYQRLVEAAPHAPEELSAKLFSQANQLYKGAYLQGCNKPWIKSLRHSLEEIQSDVQANLGNLYDKQAKKDIALARYSFAFKYNPAQDEVLRRLMKLFIDLGMPCHAVIFYKRYEEILRERYGIKPGEQLVALYENAKRAGNC